MDKEEAVKLLLEHMHWHHGEWAIGGRLGLGELAEAVSQAHEQEVAAAQVQVAVMATALQELRDDWWDKHYPADVFDGSSGDEGALEVVRLREVIYQALSAAPKVLYHKIGIVSHVAGGIPFGDWDGKATVVSETGLCMDGYIGTDGQQVEVYAMECSVVAPEGQNNEQEE